MIARSPLLKASSASLAAAIVCAVGATGAAAECKYHAHSATGSAAAIQFLASTNAKYAWKSVVASHDGGSYDTWGKAANKSVNCKKSGPGATWVCTARGRPCK